MLQPSEICYKVFMSIDLNTDNESPIGPASSPLSKEDKERILEVALERMVMIGGKVFGLEDDAEPEVFVDCLARL